LGEPGVRQLAPEHIPWRPIGTADDLFFADDLAALGDPVKIASAAGLLV
jgi:hypothetical protein